MNYRTLIDKYVGAEPALNAWGDFVTTTVVNGFAHFKSEAKSEFFVIPPKPRLKGALKVAMKARSRRLAKGEPYTDPWNQITDKVGTRFVTLLEADAQKVCIFIESSSEWQWRKDVDHQQQKEEDPSRFLYASEHYIVWPNEEREISGVLIPEDTTCEIQVRTLLQHAYSELTHETTYKGSYKADNDILRRVARSMALIETTDGIFGDVTAKIRAFEAPIEELHRKLINIWNENFAPIDEDAEEFSLLVIHDVWPYVEGRDTLVKRIDTYFKEQPNRIRQLASAQDASPVFQIPAGLLIVFLLERQRTALRASSMLAYDELSALEGATGILLNPDR